MKRAELLRTKEYWVFQIQNKLFNILEKYQKDKKLNQSQLAEQMGFNKSYLSQVLNGNFDHKISKLVEFSLAAGKVPIVSFVDLNQYIKDDSEDKFYDLMTALKSHEVFFKKDSVHVTLNVPKSIYPKYEPTDNPQLNTLELLASFPATKNASSQPSKNKIQNTVPV